MIEHTVTDFQTNCEIQIKVGKDAYNNWSLIDESKQNDIWFHVEDHPSAHVVISVPPKSQISKQTIIHAASLCKLNSKLSNNNKVTIIYTQIKNISKGKAIGSIVLKKKCKKIII